MAYICCNCMQMHPVGRESIHLEALRTWAYISNGFLASKFFSLGRAREMFSVSLFIFSPLGGKFILNQLHLCRWSYFSYGSVSPLESSKACNHWCGRFLEEKGYMWETNIPERGDRGKWHLSTEWNKIHLLNEKDAKKYGKEIIESKDMRLSKTFSQEDCSC